LQNFYLFGKTANFFAENCRDCVIDYFGQFKKKIAEVAKTFLGSFVPRPRLCINFGKKLIGPRFGRLFHKLIWST
jgi:hypothetical protein